MNQSKIGFKDNIEEVTLRNESYRKVLFTGKKMQLVVMTLKPGEEIGMEVHSDTDQFFRVEQGKAKVIMNQEEILLSEGDVIIVPAGTNHNVINSGDEILKLYTIYSPPEHPEDTEQETKP